jgi:hypothetical protein
MVLDALKIAVVGLIETAKDSYQSSVKEEKEQKFEAFYETRCIKIGYPKDCPYRNHALAMCQKEAQNCSYSSTFPNYCPLEHYPLLSTIEEESRWNPHQKETLYKCIISYREKIKVLKSNKGKKYRAAKYDCYINIFCDEDSGTIVQYGGDHCECCQEFRKSSCENTCPIGISSEEQGCKGTPWMVLRDYLRANPDGVIDDMLINLFTEELNFLYEVYLKKE